MANEIERHQGNVNPRHMGSRDEIVSVKNRILSMMPQAERYPMDVLWAMAQMAVAYRLDPFGGEIYLAKFGKVKDDAGVWQDQYVPMIGIRGARALARRQSHYVTDNGRVMEPAETKAYRRELYHVDDIGIEIKLWRLDAAAQCKQVGIEYFPVVAQGFWRVQAKQVTENNAKVWKPDEIPNTWTAKQVAEKRAEKSALVKAFDLRVNLEQLADPATDYDAMLENMASTHERDTAILQPPNNVIYEEDGDVLYAAT